MVKRVAVRTDQKCNLINIRLWINGTEFERQFNACSSATVGTLKKRLQYDYNPNGTFQLALLEMLKSGRDTQLPEAVTFPELESFSHAHYPNITLYVLFTPATTRQSQYAKSTPYRYFNAVRLLNRKGKGFTKTPISLVRLHLDTSDDPRSKRQKTNSTMETEYMDSCAATSPIDDRRGLLNITNMSLKLDPLVRNLSMFSIS